MLVSQSAADAACSVLHCSAATSVRLGLKPLIETVTLVPSGPEDGERLADAAAFAACAPSMTVPAASGRTARSLSLFTTESLPSRTGEVAAAEGNRPLTFL